MKKIIFVHLYNDRSGSPKVLRDVINAIYTVNPDLELLTSTHDNGFLSGLKIKRIPVFYRRSERKAITLLYYGWSQICLFIKCLPYFRHEVVFYVNTMLPVGAALAARIIGKKVIYHVHETSIKPRYFKKFLRSVLKLTANKIIFVSRYLRDVEGFENIPQEVVYNSVSHRPERFQKIESDDKFDVLMLCSLKKYKGIFEFVQLAKMAQDQPLLSFTLILNADEDEVISFCRENFITDNMRVFPRQSDVSKYFRFSKVVLNLSKPDEWIETFGLTVLEAMSYSLPVIVPPVGGPREIVRHGVEGFLISSYDIETIYKEIVNLMLDSDRYSAMAHQAFRRSKEFSIESFQSNILKTIQPELR